MVRSFWVRSATNQLLKHWYHTGIYCQLDNVPRPFAFVSRLLIKQILVIIFSFEAFPIRPTAGNTFFQAKGHLEVPRGYMEARF